MESTETLHQRLHTLAHNLWWSWHPSVQSLFHDLDPTRFRVLSHNPVALLREFPPERLAQQLAERGLAGRVNYAYRRMQEHLVEEDTWASTHAGVLHARPVAYFSAEFGIHESLPIYSGGLGVLAGDHLKSASDLGVPLVGVGLLYTQGYFLQRVGADGWQQETYLDVDVARLPVSLALTPKGEPINISIRLRDATLHARVWQAGVGRTRLLLLDTDVEANRPEDRELTERLYGGDDRTRIRQEVLLGVGGIRALSAAGIVPGVVHLNEGHSAFAAFELIRQRMHNEGLTFDEARRRSASSIVFTTHTPVPAGHDRFTDELMDEHLSPMREELGLDHEAMMALGRVNPSDQNEPFCMTVLALKNMRKSNAVSSLHGHVSRQMWQELWPHRSEDEVPIGHITNGVHVHSWLAPAMRALYDRHFIPDWAKTTYRPETWSAVTNIDDGELWETHRALKSELIEFVRRRGVWQAERRNESNETVEQARKALALDPLMIGFARRFATYKRATLIMRDMDALERLINNPERPVQLVFAGKSHPRDEGGKRLLQQVIEMSKAPRYAGKIVFVEDYDINVGRHLVQGVDVWLNNPRRPLEASGTSGQKVVLNGGLNLSILDGWWAEAYDGTNGFAVGDGQAHASVDAQDDRDCEDLERVLFEEVVPLYYARDRDGVPRKWIARMKRSIRTLGWRFNAERMVMDYVRESYLPAAGGRSCDMP